jgi:N-acetylglucosamine kinase-like BadF-type ATPase
MLFLGVDGGQTATLALIAGETGRVLGSGVAGPCNHVQGAGGREKFIAAIRGSVEAACAQAGVAPAFVAACLGFSGGPEDKEALVREILSVEKLLVTDDAAIALTGAVGRQPGIVTIAGTGSISYGRDALGKRARAGGWGYLFGDEGSAFDLVRQALRVALRFEEGWGPRTALHAMLLEQTGARTANELMHRFYTSDFPRSRIAALAPCINETAARGDVLAIELLHAAAGQLAMITAAVRGQLFAAGEPVRVAWMGGVFGSVRVRERFRTLVELEDGCTAGPAAHSPAVGALMEAFQLAGLAVEPSNVPSAMP